LTSLTVLRGLAARSSVMSMSYSYSIASISFAKSAWATCNSGSGTVGVAFALPQPAAEDTDAIRRTRTTRVAGGQQWTRCTSESCPLCNFTNSPTIFFTTSILPKAALHAYFRNSSAIRFEAKNHDGPVRTIHIPVRTVTKREQWQDPDTSSSVSSCLRAVIYAMSGGRPSVCASGGALAFYTFVQRTRG